METNVHVELGARSYDIQIGVDTLDNLGFACRNQGIDGHCLIVTDSNVGKHYSEQVLHAMQTEGYSTALVEVPAGEPSKSQAELVQIYGRAIEAGLDRRGFMVALGGGVVGDLTGFAAASFLRGVKFVQVPTSLLAMVDSAVGGKTGINLPHGKNLVGAFHQPALVHVDLDVLNTLPSNEFAAGMAEVIKYGVIQDAPLFAYLEENVDAIRSLAPECLKHIVQRSCEIKADVVRQDEREGGLRAILNYGHTLGHAVEAVTAYRKYLHGEALGIGLTYAAELSGMVRDFSPEAIERQLKLVEAYALPTRDSDLDWSELRAAMSVDKKSVDSTPRFVLAEEIGRVVFGCEVDEAQLKNAWDRIA